MKTDKYIDAVERAKRMFTKKNGYVTLKERGVDSAYTTVEKLAWKKYKENGGRK